VTVCFPSFPRGALTWTRWDHSNEILDELFDEIRTAIACLYRCSEAIAMLDMLAS
jgi:hypothetical protein